jgi:aminoglycoside phosphotransferase family enzyme/predicted kinase
MTEPAAALVETHISVVTMVGDRAYKLLKPVETGFLDHRRREDRLAACRRETEVNRRFAPDVYLGVLDVVGEDGRPLDHLIAMRRMPGDRCLDRLASGPDWRADVRAVAREVARIHREAPRSAVIDRAGAPAAVAGLWEEGIDGLERSAPGVVPGTDAEELRRLARRYVGGRHPLLEERVLAGWIRDGHGDLLAADVYVMPGGPRILDCLAFDDRLRHGDILSDAAFLAMDLESAGHAEAGRLLMSEWASASGESHPASLGHHYIAYRAHVRSKVAAIRAVQGDPGAAGRARALHQLALEHLRRARVRLVMVGGPPGTGKTTVADGIAAACGWVLLSSDAVRKEMAGLPRGTGAPGAYRAGRYAPAATGTVYEELLRRARDRLVRGETVVLDASWMSAGRRERARSCAASCAADVIELRCAAPAALAHERIARRRTIGTDPSDATGEIAERVSADFDPWPESVRLDTVPAIRQVVAEALRLVSSAR